MAVFVFLFYLAAGVMVALGVVRLGPEGRRFFLFNGALALTLGGLAVALRLVTNPPPRLVPQPWFVAFALAGLALLAVYVVLTAVGRELRWLLRASAGLAVAAVLLDARSLFPPATVPLPGGGLLHLFNAATSAWLAGSVLLAMILGHYYLVIPNLSIQPLRALYRFTLTGLGLRVVVVALAGTLWWAVRDPVPMSVADFLNEGVFVLQRVLFGLLIPVSLAWFTWKTIEIRSTQSATGILYVVVFLTLVGEALSVYLSLETSIPL